ncbi:MAG: hypothetical protein ABIN48_03445 [Ginsengibacter sp.]
MKKILLTLSVSLLLFACDSNKSSNEEVGEDVEASPNIGVENVNGNIPDTINTIDISTNKVDSTNLTQDTTFRK